MNNQRRIRAGSRGEAAGFRPWSFTMNGFLAALAVLLCAVPSHAADNATVSNNGDEVSLTGEERLQTEKENLSEGEYRSTMDAFVSAPQIARDPDLVTFVDGSGRLVKQRPLAYKTVGTPTRMVKVKPSAGGGTREIKGSTRQYKIEEAYAMEGGQGVFIAHWKEPNTPSDLNEDSRFEFTEALDRTGNPVARIDGDYRLDAAPGLSYFVGMECLGGLANPTGTVAFFDKNGTLKSTSKVFDFAGRPYIAFTQDGSRVIVTMQGYGAESKSGMAMFDQAGKLLWKKEDSGWQLAGPLDPLGSHENGEHRGPFLVSPQKSFYVFSLRDGVSSYSLDGKNLWTNPRWSNVIAADDDWSRVVLWDVKTQSVVLLDPSNGKEVASFASPCIGHAYREEDTVQLRGGLVLVKMGETSPKNLENGRCYAVADIKGNLVWKRIVKRSTPAHWSKFSQYGVALAPGNRLVIREDSKRTLKKIAK